MTLHQLQVEVLDLLDVSGVSSKTKTRVRKLLPWMQIQKLKKVHSLLKSEHEQISKLGRKQERMELKFSVLMDKMVKRDKEE